MQARQKSSKRMVTTDYIILLFFLTHNTASLTDRWWKSKWPMTLSEWGSIFFQALCWLAFLLFWLCVCIRKHEDDVKQEDKMTSVCWYSRVNRCRMMGDMDTATTCSTIHETLFLICSRRSDNHAWKQARIALIDFSVLAASHEQQEQLAMIHHKNKQPQPQYAFDNSISKGSATTTPLPALCGRPRRRYMSAFLISHLYAFLMYTMVMEDLHLPHIWSAS